MLTGFVSASNDARENANKSNSIALGHSPFQHNVKFTVGGFTTLTRSRADADGHVLEPDGTFNAFVHKTIAENSTKTNGEILTAIVKGCENKQLIVERVPYVGLSKDGRRFATSLVKINFVD